MNIRGYLAAWLRVAAQYLYRTLRLMNGFMTVWCGDGNQTAEIHTGPANCWSTVDLDSASNPDRNIRPVFFLLSLDHRWSIVQSMRGTTEGGECLVWIFFASCFLLIETVFSTHQRRFAVSERWEIRSGVKRAGVISWSWARLYCISTRLDRSPLANICPRWKPSPCTCKKQVACELNGWHWRFNTQSLIENRKQSSSILIGRGTQKTHQMKVPYMMK